MTEREDHTALGARLEREADELERRSDRLGDEVQSVRQDWQRKREDDAVPGAPPPQRADDEERASRSPAPEAPPPGAGPSASAMASAGAAGPPTDVIDEDG